MTANLNKHTDNRVTSMTSQKFHHIKKTIAPLVLQALFLSGCGSDEPEDHLQKGVEYFNKGEYENAILELKTSNQSDKNIAETYYYLALLDEKNKQYKAMAENLNKTIELAPTHKEARLKLGKIQLLLGQTDAALEQAEAVLAGDNQNHDAILLKASVFLKRDGQAQAESLVADVLRANPKHTDALLLSGLILAKKENFSEALSTIDSAIKLNPKDTTLRLFKIQLDTKTNNIDGVIAGYRELVDLYPDNDEFKITLAKAYAQTGNSNEAESILKAMMLKSPDEIKLKLLLLELLASSNPARVQTQISDFTEQYKKDTKTLFAISKWLLAQKNVDEAQKILNQIIVAEENVSHAPAAKVLLAKIDYDRKDFASAQKTIDDILANNPNHIDTRILQARLLIHNNKIDEGIDALTKILWDKADSEEALILLAQCYTAKGDEKQAEKQYQSILQVNPGNLEALARVYDDALASKSFDYAEELIGRALYAQPGNLALLEKLVKLYFAAKNWEKAEKSVQKMLMSNNPQAKPLAKYLQGQIFQGQGQCAKAIESYKELLADVPKSQEGLTSMAECYESLGDRVGMINNLNDLIRKDAQNIPASIVLSDLLANDKQFGQASALLTGLIAGNKNTPQLYASLAKVKIAQKDAKAALSIYQDGLKQNPKDTRLLLSLASLYETQGNYDAAIANYEELLAVNPALDIAANNLATILSEHSTSAESLSRAVQLTEKFKDSKQPFYKDTYAWALLKQGDILKSISLLNQIITLAPDVPVFRYHLAVAHHKNGNNGTAVAELREALELAKKQGGFPNQKEAEDLFNKINVRPKFNF